MPINITIYHKRNWEVMCLLSHMICMWQGWDLNPSQSNVKAHTLNQLLLIYDHEMLSLYIYMYLYICIGIDI